MRRRELFATVGSVSLTTLGGCTALRDPPVTVESVQTTVTGESGTTVLTVVELSLESGVDSHTTPVEMKIERGGERVAYGWVKETVFTDVVNMHTDFPVVEIDASVPIRPDEYDAFGRIEGKDWMEATHVKSIGY
jgi:hypothetical protein